MFKIHILQIRLVCAIMVFLKIFRKIGFQKKFQKKLYRLIICLPLHDCNMMMTTLLT